MKTLKHFSFRIAAVAALALVFALPTRAQMTDNGYATIDWQFNFPKNDRFAEDGSGWGMNVEGGYYLCPHFSLGGFAAFHSNHAYVGRQTLSLGSGSLNTDQQHTAFQVPFGVASRFAWNRGGDFQPYVGVKLGAQYAQLKSVFNVFEMKDDTWGFYVSPEVGCTFYPWAYGPGLHVAAYYSYGTNKGKVLTYRVDGMSNFGVRVGVGF